MKKKVLVGISGGIDSTATILLLREQGYEVEALFVDMLDCEMSRESVAKLAEKLKVKLYIAPRADDFKRLVVDQVITEHEAGRTPSPCTLCNPLIKWAALKEYALKLDIDWIATGHYINIVERGGRYYVSRGIDPIKDQSYYLYSLGQDILSMAVTPLGNYTKVKIREYLAANNFEEVCAKNESQGVCFAKSGYSDFLLNNTVAKEGEVVDEDGNIIGSHCGYQLYTIGQKRGFALFDSTVKLEVRSLRAAENRVVVGAPLLTHEAILENAWMSVPEDGDVTINIRGLGRNPLKGITAEWVGDKRLKVKLHDEEFWAPAAGQPAVLYQGDLVVGGGVLASF